MNLDEARPAASGAGLVLSPARGVAFTRHRYEMPLLMVFMAIATIELIAVHLLVSLWSASAAWLLSGATVVAMIQIAMLIRGLKRWPTIVGETAMVVRYGRSGAIEVPLGALGRVDDVSFAPEERGADVFRATILAQPNIALRLAPPVVVKGRARTTILLRLDEPALFRDAIAASRALLERPGELSAGSA